MYLLEPLLNRALRYKMRSVLRIDTGAYSVPPPGGCERDNFLLYIHIPFCESLCPYCSFHREPYEVSRATLYFSALWKELEMYQALGYRFRALYVGGGTPTVAMNMLLKTLAAASDLFDIREISVETNPNHLTADRLDLLVAAGVNRLSVGVQSFDATVLQHIGRLEKYGDGTVIQNRLRSCIGKFDTLNIDMMFNIPLQTEESLRRDLDIIHELMPEQVTFYPLMAAPSVAKALKQSVGPVDFRQEKHLYTLLLDRMRDSYTGSTAWCFSRKHSMIDEYIIAYDHYAGAGSGAFGYFNNAVYINTFSIDDYIGRVSRNEFPVTMVRPFSRRETIHYYLLMKLFGLKMSRVAFAERFGKDYSTLLPLEHFALTALGAVRETPSDIELTDRGRYLWVMAMREFFIAVDTMRDTFRANHQSDQALKSLPCHPHQTE